MKIRIKGNTLRLRLMQKEVETFETTGQISDAIAFGILPEQSLRYILERKDIPKVKVNFDGSVIRLLIPEAMATKWTSTDSIGINSSIDIGNGEQLSILIEKDFKCLKARKGEDESDAYPNPTLNN